MLEKSVKNKLINKLQAIKYGELFLTSPDGELIHFKGQGSGPVADIQLNDWRVIVNLMIRGDIGFAQDYRDGYFHTKNLTNLLLFGLCNEDSLSSYMRGNWFYNIVAKLGYLTQRNTIQQSKKNIYTHYDLGNEFYSLWLDQSMTYSSAIYLQEDDTLFQAQHQKYQRILDKLPNGCESVLEIGCGWGGFIQQAMQHGDYNIKGITLSEEQKKYAVKRLEKYADNVEIALEDYRHQKGKYDMIVSIEMLEAVGKKYWPVYFRAIKKLLNQQGRAIIQTIIIDDKLFKNYCKGTDVIRTHIFPGGMLPCMSILQENIQKVNMKISDSYFFGMDYAKTLEEWLKKFSVQENTLLQMGFDKRFQRMWKFYLCSCIAAFKMKRINVVQLEICHDR